MTHIKKIVQASSPINVDNEGNPIGLKYIIIEKTDANLNGNVPYVAFPSLAEDFPVIEVDDSDPDNPIETMLTTPTVRQIIEGVNPNILLTETEIWDDINSKFKTVYVVPLRLREDTIRRSPSTSVEVQTVISQKSSGAGYTGQVLDHISYKELLDLTAVKKDEAA